MMVVFSVLERLEGDGGRQAGHSRMSGVNRWVNRVVNRWVNLSMMIDVNLIWDLKAWF